jgi:phage-related protein (TIGR01555 family)
MSVKQFFKNIRKSFEVDMFYDPRTQAGGSEDSTQRQRGQRTYKSNIEYMRDFQANGFIQNIVEQPAEDATREWIDITTNRDDDLKLARLIENRLTELQIQKKIKELVKFSRMYPKGSMLYYGCVEDVPVTDEKVGEPLDLNSVQQIDFINVIEEPDRFWFYIENRSEPTKKFYNDVSFYVVGRGRVHESRLSWLCNNFYPYDMMGISIIDVIWDSVVAQDGALWSISTLMRDLATKIFKSDLITSMSKKKITELLYKLRNDMVTNSAIALKSNEDYQKLVTNMTGAGIKDMFDFISKNLSGTSRMSEKILFGEAHGVVTGDEQGILNYYANVAKFQENDLRPIIDKIIRLVIHEQRGEIFKAVGNAVDQIDFEFAFKPLWKLSPTAQASTDFQNAQRDKIDIVDSGKMSPEEARTLDPRMDELEDFTSGEERNKSIGKFAPSASRVHPLTLPENTPRGNQGDPNDPTRIDPAFQATDPEEYKRKMEKVGKPQITTYSMKNRPVK